MMKRIIWGIAVSVLATGAADAALLSRAGGQAYYDTALDITWVADASLAKTSGYDSDGQMNWNKTQSWIGSLNSVNYLGGNNWRLPETPQPDPSCDGHGPGFVGCTGSEMGHLFNVDGISALAPGPFSNVQADRYWSGTTVVPGYAWVFNFYFGRQRSYSEGFDSPAWAVRDGDIALVSPVPVPAVAWLVVGAFAGIGAAAKRRAGTGTA